MKSITDSAWLKKFLISLVGGPLMKKLISASKDTKGTQEALIKKMVSANENTMFGKEHGFNKIKTVDDFRKAVPVRDFEGHRPYIDRMIKGEADILFAGKPISYNTTSGTTDKPKFIPVSQTYYNAHSKINKLWFYSCMKDNPTLFNGRSLSAVSAAVDGYFEDGTPYGSISGKGYQHVPGILKKTFSSPYPVICIKDYLKKYYAVTRGALAEDITYIVCPSPSNMIKFHTTIMDNFSDLVRDIHDGTLRADVLAEVDDADKDEVKAFYSANPQRAKQLEELMAKHGEGLKTKHYWPNVACVNTWKQGNFARLIPDVKTLFSESTAIRAFGYQASEARAGMILGNDWDCSALATHIYHFEFIEEQNKYKEGVETLLAHKIEKGKRYYILISNDSGLYRYDINDIVEVSDFYNQIPLIKFIQKGEGITSLTGEKISELQVIQSVDDVSKKIGITIDFFNMFCDEENLNYSLFVEFAPQTSRHNKDAFISAFDLRLREVNPEYEIKRGSKRLTAPLLKELKPDSYNKFKETLIEKKYTKDGQYKDSYLRKNPIFLTILEDLSI
jgi:hypothetical protein